MLAEADTVVLDEANESSVLLLSPLDDAMELVVEEPAALD